MQYRKLGDSDLTVSEISLGSWLTYGAAIEREQAARCVDRAFDLGINFIDTANAYGRGAAESFLGEVLAKRPRDSYVLATKVYFPMSATDRGLSRAQILKQIDGSLERLRVDYIDLYQCHRYDTATALEETLRALTDIVRQGKVRYIGFSEWSPEQIEAAFAISGGRALRLEPAAIFPAPSGARASRHPSMQAKGRVPGRLVAARPRHSDRKVPAGRSAPGGFPSQQSGHGPVHPALDAAGRFGGGPGGQIARDGSGLYACPIFAGMGASRGECRVRHRGRDQASAA